MSTATESKRKAYTGKKGFEVLQREDFKIQRKIVANMTTEAWRDTPHAAFVYEPDVTDFLARYKSLKQTDERWKNITLNTVFLKVITEGLIAAPRLNAHIDYNQTFVNGTVEEYRDVNISIPMVLPREEGMMTINIHNCEQLSLTDLYDYISDVRRRMENTDFTEAMFEVSLDNTMRLLKKGKLPTIFGRLFGASVGRGKIDRLSGKAKHRYERIPATDRLTKADIEQGTFLVSNVGSIFRGSKLYATLLDIIPPQVAAISLGNIFERMGVVTRPDGTKTGEPRSYCCWNLAFDHRAMDFAETEPFFARCDDFFAHPEQMEAWI
ncbi:MAG: 2-oxo acid dehydrogenase subunit E2 [Oscillospiraceae bacterium]|jgi:pyruvate dehydrogenase E2 component (dihydrolipoamide acetyltransferase)|nr:2-oxo acid dehydrogenase subunit E2 [Oscillospiraceae bacterium]